MLCQYRGSVSVRKQLMVVWDIAKHAKRTVNLDTTFRVVDPATGEILYEHAA